MSDVMKRRERLGDGHKAWLVTEFASWEFISTAGKVSDQLRAETSGNVTLGPEALREFTNACTNLTKIRSNYEQACQGLKRALEKEGIDPFQPFPEKGPHLWISEAVLYLQMLAYGAPSPDAQSSITGFFVHFNAWLHGNQTFAFSLPLASKLLLTDAAHVKWKDFRLPFPAFVMRIPPTLLSVSTGEEEYAVDTVLVWDTVECGQRRVRFFFMGAENKKSISIGDDAYIYITLACHGEDSTLESSIQLLISKVNKPVGVTVKAAGSDTAIDHLSRLAITMVLYLTDFPEDRVIQDNPQIAEIKKKLPQLKGKSLKNAKAKLRKLLRDKSPYLVGTRIKFDPRLEKVAHEVGHGRAQPTIASYVRGHRRTQPYGPQRSMRKVVWIDPYWRNLENDRASSKLYDVT